MKLETNNTLDIGSNDPLRINFPPKQIGTFMSEFLVTGFVLEKGEVVLAEPQRPVPNGTKLA